MNFPTRLTQAKCALYFKRDQNRNETHQKKAHVPAEFEFRANVRYHHKRRPQLPRPRAGILNNLRAWNNGRGFLLVNNSLLIFQELIMKNAVFIYSFTFIVIERVHCIRNTIIFTVQNSVFTTQTYEISTKKNS